MTPFIVFAHNQVCQVNWIYPVSWHYAFDIILRQYFDHSVPFAILHGRPHRRGGRGPAEGRARPGRRHPPAC